MDNRRNSVSRLRAVSTRRRAAQTIVLLSAVAASAGSAALIKRMHPVAPPLVEVDRVATGLGPAEAVAAAPESAGNVESRAGEPTLQKMSAARDFRGPIYSAAPGYQRYFNGRPLRPVRTIWMKVTAYSPDARSCGASADGITSSLKSVWTNGMRLVAADPRVLPEGALVSIPGYAEGGVVPVLDVGGAIKGARLDVLYPSHARAMKWGVQQLPVVVWEYAE